jgi:flagellar hook assembly protein FlgD
VVFTYELAEKQHVTCTVYNTLGQAVRCLCQTEQSAGKHRVIWDGSDSLGRSSPAGVYWVRFETPSTSTLHKIIRIE